MVRLSCLRRLRAMACGTYPSASAASSTRCRTPAATYPSPLSAREVVDCDTPASRATSFNVARRGTPACSSSLIDTLPLASPSPDAQRESTLMGGGARGRRVKEYVDGGAGAGELWIEAPEPVGCGLGGESRSCGWGTGVHWLQA